jgi:hypothetical protein
MVVQLIGLGRSLRVVAMTRAKERWPKHDAACSGVEDATLFTLALLSAVAR